MCLFNFLVLFVLLGTEEGLFYLQVNREGDPIIEQVGIMLVLWYYTDVLISFFWLFLCEGFFKELSLVTGC